MADFNLANRRGLDAVITALSVAPKQEIRWVDEEEKQASSVQVLRGTMERDMARLLEATGGDMDVATNMIIYEDADVDLERYGRLLQDTKRIYVSDHGDIVYKVEHWEALYTPDGEEIQRGPKEITEGNVAGEIPVQWAGERGAVPRSLAYRRFVFSHTLQLAHTNGLTYDFLYEMARELEAKDVFMLVRAGLKGTEPLVFRRAGLPYRGFLEGRTEGKKYMLLLHLSSLELKRPSPDDLP